jgi:predicted dehydrogenase
MTGGTDTLAPAARPMDSAELAAAIGSIDFGGSRATVIGAGVMGKQYVQALQALRAGRIRVCARSAERLAPYAGLAGVETVAGGIDRLDVRAEPDELAIIAAPVDLLPQAALRMVELGFRKLLIEKPVSLYPAVIEQLAVGLAQQGVGAFCAYNRVACASFHEVRALAAREGGITSCTYEFTEMIKPDWPQRFPAEELARWGIANSLHPISMAHGLIGMPAKWSGHVAGSLPWHPSGAVFVGSGGSVTGVPYAYHADWGSTGRWSVEVHTRAASYRLCPLEQVARRATATGPWEPVPVASAAAGVKAGVTEQTAAMLSDELRAKVPLFTLRDAAALTRYAESVFGYDGH